MECWIYQTHAGVRGFVVGFDEVVGVSGRIRIQREIRPEYHVFQPVRSSSLSLLPAGVRGCRISIPLSLSSLFLSLFLCRRPNLSNHIFFLKVMIRASDHINIKKLINIKNNYIDINDINKKYIY